MLGGHKQQQKLILGRIAIIKKGHDAPHTSKACQDGTFLRKFAWPAFAPPPSHRRPLERILQSLNISAAILKKIFANYNSFEVLDKALRVAEVSRLAKMYCLILPLACIRTRLWQKDGRDAVYCIP